MSGAKDGFGVSSDAGNPFGCVIGVDALAEELVADFFAFLDECLVVEAFDVSGLGFCADLYETCEEEELLRFFFGGATTSADVSASMNPPES